MLEVVKDLGYAPIINLSTLSQISTWSNAAYSFINYGNGYLLSDLLKTSNPSESNILMEFSNTFNLNLIHHFKSKIQPLKGIINKEYPFLGSLFISRTIQEFSNNFKETSKDSIFLLQLTKWYFKNKKFGIC
jgi:hypothetical protein